MRKFIRLSALTLVTAIVLSPLVMAGQKPKFTPKRGVGFNSTFHHKPNFHHGHGFHGNFHHAKPFFGPTFHKPTTGFNFNKPFHATNKKFNFHHGSTFHHKGGKFNQFHR